MALALAHLRAETPVESSRLRQAIDILSRLGFASADASTSQPTTLVSAEPTELFAMYLLCQEQQDRPALERAVSTFENLLRGGHFNEADALLKAAVVTKLNPSVLLGILTITYHAKTELRERGGFLARSEPCLVRSLGADRAEKLLAVRR